MYPEPIELFRVCVKRCNEPYIYLILFVVSVSARGANLDAVMS